MADATARYSSGVFRGLNRLLAAALVAGAFLVAPSAALACNSGSASAVNVYKECLPSGGGDKPSDSKPTVSTPVSHRTTHALKRAGKDKSRLLSLVKGRGKTRLIQKDSAFGGSATSASALGDLGSGPTALLVILAGTALVLLATTGLRGYRRWHRS
jgi:hypothetical protein